MDEMTHLSLFTGIGGLDLAAERAGFRTVGQCEFADYPTRVLEKHWPDVPRWRDIRTLTKESFYEKTGLRTIDVISGGFPCQPFSVAGKRRGRNDDRYLWPEMCRVIDELRPTWIVGENVAGLVSMAESAGKPRVESRAINRLPDSDYYEAVLSRQERMLLEDILQDLERIGYAVQPFIVPACAVGAPHRRDRLAIVAYCESKGERRISVQQRTARPSDVDVDGGGEDVADAKSQRCNHGYDGTHQWAASGKIDTSASASICARDVSDAESAECPGCGAEARKRRSEFGCGGWWSTEPDVGRGYDGFSCWMDRFGGLSDAGKERAREILRDLREETVSEAIQWTLGRFNSVSEKEVLLALLCEYEENSNRSMTPEEGGAFSKELLRNLWRTIELARTSHRRKYFSQLAGEYSDALLRLSYGAPSLVPQAWFNGSWEDGLPRVSSGLLNRVDRLKCLGNAVVPQQFYPIFRTIAEVERMMENE